MTYSSKYLCLLYISTDGGQTWSRDIGTWSAYLGESGLVVKPDEPNVALYRNLCWGSCGSNILTRSTKEMSFGNGCRCLHTFPIGTGSHKNVRALAFDPQDPDILYAALGLNSDFKLLKSLDGGLSFTQEYAHDQQFITLAPHPTDRQYHF